MFGKRFFGRRWFGERYWGTGGADAVCEYFFTNFEAEALGDSPTDWTQRGTSTDHVLSIGNTTPPFKRRAVTLTSDDANLIAFSVDAIDAFGRRDQADVVLAVQRDATDEHERFTVHVRAQGSGTITDGYQFAIDFVNQRIRIYKLVGGVLTNPFSDLAITHDAGDYMVYRFRATGQATTTLRARTWDPNDVEPSTWGLTATDSSSPITAAGWIGVAGYVPSGTGESTLNFLSVATGGCIAPVPTMNGAFLDWLDRMDVTRCVLAELSAVGYNSSGHGPLAKTVYAYMANMGYNSWKSDDPPSQHYPAWIEKVPTFGRQMNTTFSGKADTSFGSIQISNPAPSVDDAAARDHLLRMKWRRDYVTLYLGDVSWPKSSFRKMVVGTLKQPSAPSKKVIDFPIGDLLEALNRQLQTNRFTSGPYEGKLKPMLFGDVLWLEPIPSSDTVPEYQLNDGAFNRIQTVFDDGVPLTGAGTVASVDTGADTITMVDPHGLSEDSRVALQTTGTMPSPLIQDVFYYVLATGLTATDVQLSATRGGAALNITSAGSGTITYIAKNWWEDAAAGKITLVQDPVGRIVCFDVAQTLSYLAGEVLDTIVFDKFGLSLDFKDQDAFDELDVDLSGEVVGWMRHTEPITTIEAVHRIATGIFAWYGASFDGLLQVGLLKLPAVTAVMEFSKGDTQDLKMTARLMPVNRDTLEVRVNIRQWLNGPMGLPSTDANRDLINQPHDVVTSPFAGGPGIPLDDYPDLSDTRDFQPLDAVFQTQVLDTVIVTGAADRVAEFLAKTIGVFKFKTRLRAITLQLGDTIQLEHPRMGWKLWDSGDPASPDNTDDIDSTKAVVMGIDVNLGEAFPVTLTVYRQIPGYYPEEDVN